MAKLIYLLIAVFWALDSRSQIFRNVVEKEYNGLDSVQAIGTKLSGQRFGHWIVQYESGELVERRFYNFDTSDVFLDSIEIAYYKRVMNSINSDSIIYSFEQYSIPYDSNLDVGVHVSIPLIRYNKQGLVLSQIKKIGQRYYIIGLDSFGIMNSIMSIRNGRLDGMAIYISANQSLIINYFNEGVPSDGLSISYDHKNAINLIKLINIHGTENTLYESEK